MSFAPKATVFKNKRLFRLLLLIAAAFLVYAGVMTIRDSRRHAQLNSSIDTLQAKLKTNGIDATKTSGCGRPYSEFGTADKRCSVGLVANIDVLNLDDADRVLRNFRQAIEDNNEFKVVQALPEEVKDKNNFTFGYGMAESYSDERPCTSRYDFAESAKTMRLSFSCDDTSWLTGLLEI